MIALAQPNNLKHIQKAIEPVGGRAFVARKTADGVETEERDWTKINDFEARRLRHNG